MKGNKACGPDLIPIEVWKKMGAQGIVFLEKVLNEAITSGIPSSWRLSELTPLFKGKSFILECSNYRGIKHLKATGADNRSETKKYCGLGQHPVRI